jgi:DNA mismatch repair protein MutS
MMDQYKRIKAKHRDSILFFRLGDFYEMFFDDALLASSLLDLTLTQRQGQPMCGIPYHAAKPYIARLLKAGKKVAICEQLTAPNTKGIVERDVVEIVTPGTTIEEDFIEQDANNYLVSLCRIGTSLCLAFLDVSTGEFRAHASETGSDGGEEFVRSELSRLSPKEIIVQQSLFEHPGIRGVLSEWGEALIEKRPDWSFDPGRAQEDLSRRFGMATLKGFGFSDESPELAAAAILLEYLDQTAKAKSPHIRSILPYDHSKYLSLDEATRKNLELLRNLSTGSDKDTLIHVLDRTKTAGGYRRLRRWVLQPLNDMLAIEVRLDSVEHLYRNQLFLQELRLKLGAVLDTERLAARLAMDKAHAKDILALRDSLSASLAILRIPAMAALPPYIGAAPGLKEIAVCESVVSLIGATIIEEPSILLTEGNLIKIGIDTDLDRLRSLKDDATKVLEAYLEEEREVSGIQNLRIRYNKIIGYYLEVSKGKIDAVPSHFIRRQSLVAGERYTTDRLADLESEINGATEKITEIERRLFLAHRESLKAYLPAIEDMADAISRIDVIAGFAQAAMEGGYSRPQMVREPTLSIRQGRHPVVEACLPSGAFVPNDLDLGGPEPGFALITGPNMAGKSTVLRQTALICLMAHLGSFVPAQEATIGLVDKIFCRVGAQDNLARGESTFLVEMHETAYILNTATARSLVVMDEVGRGTGTLDGVSIAWSVSEYLLDRIACRCLFATHYHELTSLRHEGLKNLSMAVLENEGDIVFLKKLKEGPAAGSYGLHVAKLAGIPEEVLRKAKNLQATISTFEKSLSPDAKPSLPLPSPIPAREPGLFPPEEMAISTLKSLDPDRLTPLQALQLLVRLKSTMENPGN